MKRKKLTEYSKRRFIILGNDFTKEAIDVLLLGKFK